MWGPPNGEPGGSCYLDDRPEELAVHRLGVVLEPVHVPGCHKELVTRREQVALGGLGLEHDLLVLRHRDGDFEGVRLALGHEEHLGG